MADVSLTVNGVTFTFNDGDVERVSSSISPRPENAEVTSSGPMSGYNYDYDYVAKTITISGYLTPATSTRTSTGTITTILSQKQWLESLANGQQQPITFTSTYETQSVLDNLNPVSPYQASFTSTEVMVQGMDFNEMGGEPSRLKFSMSFIVGNG